MDFKKILREIFPLKCMDVVFSVLRLASNMYLVLIIQKLVDYIIKGADDFFVYFKSDIFNYFLVLPLFLVCIFLSNYFYNKLLKKGELLIKNPKLQE